MAAVCQAILGNKKATQKVAHWKSGVPTGIRTPVPTVKGSCHPLHAMQVLYQLSYTPEEKKHCIEHLSKNQDPYEIFLECSHVGNNDRINQVNQERAD